MIDVFYKIKALRDKGTGIILHCFQYGRKESPELEKICSKVYYYKRLSGLRYFLNNQPYIVCTRTSPDLYGNILRDDHPVLCEGLHTTGFALNQDVSGRKIIVRAHNIEHDYYRGLAGAEKNPLRKLYFYSESKKLKTYERKLPADMIIAAISEGDMPHFTGRFKQIIHLPPFHPFTEVSVSKGIGDYVLFHGNLSVPENIHSLIYLSRYVFPYLQCRIIVAGKDPSPAVQRLLKPLSNLELVANPWEKQMQDLVNQAQINLLHSFQSTGIKLKLLHALYKGRHCVTNHHVVINSGLEQLCHTENSAGEMIHAVNSLITREVAVEEVELRKKLLNKLYSNSRNADRLLSII